MADTTMPKQNQILLQAIEALQKEDTPQNRARVLGAVLDAKFVCPVVLTPEPPRNEKGKAIMQPDTKIGIMETLCSSDFTNFFMDFAEKHPKISLKINVVTTLEAMSGLNKGAFDIIFLLDKKIVRPHWKTFRCFPADIFFFCAKNHPLAQKKEVSVQQLLGERFILTEQGCNYRQVFESYLESQGLRLQCLTEIGHTNYIIQAVCRRLGIGLLPIFTLHHALEEEKISLIDVKDYSIRLYIQAIYNTQRCISLPMQTFLQQLEQFSFS